MNRAEQFTDQAVTVPSKDGARTDDGLKENDAILQSLQRGYSSRTNQLNARIHKLIAFCGLLTLSVMALTGAVIYLAVFNRAEPYVLEVDAGNNVSYGGMLSSSMELDDRHTAPELQEFVENWRSVTPDNFMQKRNVTRLYCMIPKGSVTERKMNEYFTSGRNDPFVRNIDRSVSTRTRQVSKLDGKTWQVEWYETVRKHDGSVVSSDNLMKATMIVEKSNPDPGCIEGNPIGVYVMDINWTNVQ